MIKAKHWSISIAIGIMILFLIIIYYAFNPELEKLFPPCPFHYITGYQCPGCGSQRALHALLHLDIIKAISHNLLLVLAVPYSLLYCYFEVFKGKIQYPKIYNILFGKKTSIAIIFIIMLYSILRNIL